MAVCSEVSSLRSAEEGVVGCLEAADLRRFLDDSCALGAIPQGVKKDFASLDPEAVPRSLMVRYLLLHVYEWLEANPRLYERWLKVLSRYVSEELLCKVRQGYAMLVSPKVSAETMCLADGIEEGFKCGIQGGVNFRERHVSILTEILVGWSAKWYQIGLSLNLPHNYLDQLRTLLVIHGCEVCLSKVLHEWIVGQNEYAKPPTVESLKQVLRSDLVGLGDVANQLDDQLSKHGVSLNDEEPLPKRPRLAAPPVEIVSQSRDITVVEGKSTLLEVQVETRDQTNISYQWLKDGLPLEEGGEFSGVTRPILYLHATSLTSGTYICAVRFHDGADSVSSEPILVQISLPPLKKILVDRYCSQPEIPVDSWPPQSSNMYINLALIKQGSINKAGEYARNTIQGNLDDIVSDKESVEYEAVFCDLKSEDRLLIEGRPGSGKTTLVHKFSQDWGKGDIWLESVELLFLVHLRGFFNDPNISLRKIIQCYYKRHIDEIEKSAEDRSGEGLCFVLDGLDEYSLRYKGDNFIFQLITRDVLPKAVVIVASRPAATAMLRSIATKRVEVLGFLKEQIYQYVDNYFPEGRKAGELRRYLGEHPNVRHMCYLPIHSTMVCFLFNLGSSLPLTETEIYEEFTRHTLLRALTRKRKDELTESADELELLESADELPDVESKVFHQICKLAYKKTISSKQVMRKSEVRDFFTGNKSLGLITIDCMASKCGFENLYTFLHLTFQEYLAAYHISKLKEDEQLKVIREYGKSRSMYVVWKFFCGLVKFQEGNVHKFESLLQSKSKLLKGDMFSVRCAFESQQPSVCDLVIKSGESGTLSFEAVSALSDFSAIDYVITNSSIPVNSLSFYQCSSHAVEVVLAKQKHYPHLQKLFLDVIDIDDGCVVPFVACLKHFPNLQTLGLSSSGKEGAIALAEGLEHWPDLKELNLAFNMIGADGAKALAGGLKHCPGLRDLIVQWNQIGANGAKALAGGLKHCPGLRKLIVYRNEIGADGAKALADGLKHCPDLQILEVSSNGIGYSGAKAIVDGLKYHTDLLKVDFASNWIGFRNYTSLRQNMKHCKEFEIY